MMNAKNWKILLTMKERFTEHQFADEREADIEGLRGASRLWLAAPFILLALFLVATAVAALLLGKLL